MPTSSFKTFLTTMTLGIFFVIVFGLIWFFFLGGSGAPVGVGWYLFSFSAGLTMIVLACTLPLAFVIVPLSMGKGPLKGVLIALSFGLGVTITLSLYGVLAAVIGKVAIGSLGAPLETVKNWLYFVAGIFAYLFALGEIGILRLRLPTYSGAAPAAIQQQHDYLKAFLLGLFLGNIGVGCPHPATPVILTRIAVSGSVWYGWLLFFVHAVGRVLPLLLLAFLGIIGVNALSWLVARKEKIERAAGWGMVFVAGFILVLGLFSHDWWVYSGQHTLLEQITQEETVVNFIGSKLNAGPAHRHGIPAGAGLFGLPLWLGNWALAGLWALPLWLYYFKKKKEVRNFSDEERRVEAARQPLRLGLSAALTLLLGMMFIYALPDWFLFHMDHREQEGMAMNHQGEEGMAMTADTGHEVDEVHQASYREESDVQDGLVVRFEADPLPITTATSTRLVFAVGDLTENQIVTDLELEHERLMHAVGVRDDLNQFLHIHPQPMVVPALLAADYQFPAPGIYKIWSQVRRAGKDYVFGHQPVIVVGEGDTSQKRVSFERTVVVNGYRVALTFTEPAVKGEETRLAFDVHAADGQPVLLSNYLGAAMHLAVIKDDWKQFLHIHPKEKDHQSLRLFETALAHGNEEMSPAAAMTADTTPSFSVAFPESGLYKVFAQFRPSDGYFLSDEDALVAGFWIKVVDHIDRPAGTGIASSKIFLVAISLVLMTILGWVVSRFINV